MCNRLLAIILLSFILTSGMNAKESGIKSGKPPIAKFIYGVEWGAGVSLCSYDRSTFITEEGYIVESRGYISYTHINGIINGFAGVSFLRRWQASLHCGYMGLRKGERAIPVSARLTYDLADAPWNGSNLFVESGIALRHKGMDGFLAKAGYGYSFALTDGFSLALNCSALFSISHPDVYDKYSGKIVDKEDLGMSKASNFGVLLTFEFCF